MITLKGGFRLQLNSTTGSSFHLVVRLKYFIYRFKSQNYIESSVVSALADTSEENIIQHTA